MIEAQIKADSRNKAGDRLTTFVLKYPRIVHAEVMTHRLFSRNAASSRAVPAKKMIRLVRDNMFIPIAFQAKHKGMQGTEYLVGADHDRARELWIESGNIALEQAEKMLQAGITKQLVNRILEPYMNFTIILTATEFDNFFNLRCPMYEHRVSHDDPTPIYLKSRKDYHQHLINYNQKQFEDTGVRIQQFVPADEVSWQSINKSQAEIHIQALAEAMWDAMNESEAKFKTPSQWHLPFADNILIDDEQIIELWKESGLYKPEASGQFARIDLDWFTRIKLKISTARCARISYLNFEGKDDYAADIKLHDRLMSSKHWSPFEHCAKAMQEWNYDNSIRGKIRERYVKGTYNWEEIPNKYKGWCRNFKGFVQYREYVDK